MSDANIRITLPDGSVREVPRGTTPRQLAEAIGPGLARAAVAAEVNGEVWDLDRPLEADARVRLLTERDPEALAVLRHSAAHVLATAVRTLRPEAKIGFGPPIEDGFYYDFLVDRPFTPDDLAAFEDEMRRVVAADYPFERRVVSRDEARALFADDPLKLERLEEIPEGEPITIYRDGPFLDLCRGPHVPSTGRVRHFKLLHTAGAYWRGDPKRPMLQRIYGTAFFRREDLDRHLERLEEAKRRDHRKLGRDLDLFWMHPYAPGAAFWTPKGTVVYQELTTYMRQLLARHGYQEVKTPLLFHKELWERSGHWAKFRDNMFLVIDNETGRPDFSLKPMNCPSHHLLFASKRRSYRELPLRFATQDVLHRNEVSGALSGLVRVRQFAQDDAHIYLAEAQVTDEVRRLMALIDEVYGTFGLTYRARFATRPPERIGDDAMWDRAEAALRAALETTGVAYEEKPGEGAFYGPKIDLDVEDSLGRTWQLATIQLDYAAAERFDLTYVGDDNRLHRPVVIHRAIFGSFERFLAILIEHYAGAFPLWLAPVQVVVLPIADEQAEAAAGLAERLRRAGLRVELDARSETLNARIREAELQKVPVMAIVGRREATSGTVAVRLRGAERKQIVVEPEALVRQLQALVVARERELRLEPEAAPAASPP
jgi:threonyl-tRNA synthetase